MNDDQTSLAEPGVYAIRAFQPDGSSNIYIGETARSFEQRWQEHIRGLEKQSHHNKDLQRLYDKRSILLFFPVAGVSGSDIMESAQKEERAVWLLCRDRGLNMINQDPLVAAENMREYLLNSDDYEDRKSASLLQEQIDTIGDVEPESFENLSDAATYGLFGFDGVPFGIDVERVSRLDARIQQPIPWIFKPMGGFIAFVVGVAAFWGLFAMGAGATTAILVAIAIPAVWAIFVALIRKRNEAMKDTFRVEKAAHRTADEESPIDPTYTRMAEQLGGIALRKGSPPTAEMLRIRNTAF
jgi:hypothetical protein